jgi:4'-phosphopantetheinyl transferase
MIEHGNPWANGAPLAPSLSRSAVQVWRLFLDAYTLQRTLTGAANMLGPEEMRRAARMRSAAARSEFMAARSLLRVLLGRVLETDPRTVPLQLSAQGKPYVAAALPVEFNLSHSRGLVVVAIGLGMPIGVDVEFVNGEFVAEDEWMQMARDYFRADEVHRLTQVPAGPHRVVAFYQQWVRKEALAKADGSGLALPLKRLGATADEEGKAWMDAGGVDALVQSLPVGPDHVGAIATLGGRTTLEHYDAASLFAVEATT